MAAEISEITERNQPDIPGDLESRLDHLLLDLHEALKMLTDQGRLLAKHDEMLEEYRPLLAEASARLKSPLASMLPGRKRHA